MPHPAHLVPVHSLPVEIMRRIFSITYNSFDIPERAKCSMSLASVCQSWRNLALVHQELWNTFDAAWSPEYRAFVLSQLKLTHTRVDVIIPTEVAFSAGEEFLLPARDRWNSLHLACTPSSPSWALFVQLAPKLNQLGDLTLDMDAEDPDRAARIHFANLLPNIHTLHVVNIPSTIVWSPLTPKLVNLKFDMVISDKGLRAIFAQCTSLESLCINLVVSNEKGSIDTGGWRNEPLIPPPNLRSLSFHQISSGYLWHLVKYLRAPALENLVLCTMRGSLASSACLESAQNSAYYQFVSTLCSLSVKAFLTVTLHYPQFANLSKLERLTIRCTAILLRALLKGFICAVSTLDPARAIEPAGWQGVVSTVRFRDAPQDLHPPSLSELSVANIKYGGPCMLPEYLPSIHQQAITEDLRVLLRELRTRHEASVEHHKSSQRILRTLNLSGCALEVDEISEIQSYTWDLRIE